MSETMEISFRLGNAETEEFSARLAERLKTSEFGQCRAEFHKPTEGGGGFQLGLVEAVVVGIASTLAKEVVSFLWKEFITYIRSKRDQGKPVPAIVQVVIRNQVFEFKTADVADELPNSILEAAI